MTRLAYLCADPGIPPDGIKGASVHFRQLADALTRAGIELDVIMGRDRTGQDSGLKARIVAGDSEGRCAAHDLGALLVQSHFAKALQVGSPHDAVYERYSLFGLAGTAYARQRGIPHIVEVNAPLWEEAARFRGLESTGLALAGAEEVFRHADQILTVSYPLAEVIQALGVDRARITVFPNAVDAELFRGSDVAPRPEVFQGRKVITFLGSLKPWHGLDFLLAALDRVAGDDPIGLWVIGEGPERGRLEAASREGFPVRLEGPVPHARIPAMLRAADCAVAPYTEDSPPYFSPLKIVEAMAAGTCVVASDTPPVRSVIPSEDLAWLHRPGDVADFSRVLRRALQEDDLRRERIERARRHVLGQHTWDHRVRSLMDSYGWVSVTGEAQ